ncbi:MAG: MauE/DoxX family redox-associated membrane protein [Gammaproteobacteria bacterium]
MRATPASPGMVGASASSRMQMTIPPVAALALALALACLLITAGVSKISRPSRAAAAIDAYALFPAGAGRWLWLPVASLEIGIGIALLFPDSRALVAFLSAALFAGYALLIARVVWRGESDFDCGCSGGAAELRPSYSLAVRNVVLACAALATLQARTRDLLPEDWLFAAAIALLLLSINAMVGALIARTQWPTDD